MGCAPMRARRLRTAVAALGLALVLGGCATPTSEPTHGVTALFADERFAPPAAPIDADGVFELA